ncbi:hypothetical protein J6590_068387 [Homalodisca vitripennis]|nr:hypothetical protein J6590_068387 [Homalodisca vitripennis]
MLAHLPGKREIRVLTRTSCHKSQHLQLVGSGPGHKERYNHGKYFLHLPSSVISCVCPTIELLRMIRNLEDQISDCGILFMLKYSSISSHPVNNHGWYILGSGLAEVVRGSSGMIVRLKAKTKEARGKNVARVPTSGSSLDGRHGDRECLWSTTSRGVFPCRREYGPSSLVLRYIHYLVVLGLAEGSHSELCPSEALDFILCNKADP